LTEETTLDAEEWGVLTDNLDVAAVLEEWLSALCLLTTVPMDERVFTDRLEETEAASESRLCEEYPLGFVIFPPFLISFSSVVGSTIAEGEVGLDNMSSWEMISLCRLMFFELKRFALRPTTSFGSEATAVKFDTMALNSSDGGTFKRT
jgi:hypothetical protein